VPWFSAVPQDLFTFIGACEFLGGVGLIVPAMTGMLVSMPGPTRQELRS
jgi:hypothetical protein